MARMACSCVMAGPRVILFVPGATFSCRKPGMDRVSFIPMSTGMTLAPAALAITLIQEIPLAIFSATREVISLPVCVTPSSTTPLSAQKTTAARRPRSTLGVSKIPAIWTMVLSSMPRLCRGLAMLSHRVCACCMAAESRRGMGCRADTHGWFIEDNSFVDKFPGTPARNGSERRVGIEIEMREPCVTGRGYMGTKPVPASVWFLGQERFPRYIAGPGMEFMAADRLAFAAEQAVLARGERPVAEILKLSRRVRRPRENTCQRICVPVPIPDVPVQVQKPAAFRHKGDSSLPGGTDTAAHRGIFR